MLRNTNKSWGQVARWLHWGFALAILVEAATGLIMSRTFGATNVPLVSWHFWTSNIHHTAGLLLLAAALIRAGWRISGPAPRPLGRPGSLEAGAARSVHWLLYALLLFVPLSGWAALSSLADSSLYGRTVIWFFGTNGFDNFVPRIVPAVPWESHEFWRYSTFARMHRWLLYVGAALLFVHITAALRHHFILKDNTLRRMMGASSDYATPPERDEVVQAQTESSRT